jgi:hypothetical protein
MVSRMGILLWVGDPHKVRRLPEGGEKPGHRLR